MADYHAEAKGHKERLAQGHRVRAMLDRLQEQAAKLVAIYEDADGVRKEEVASLRGDNMFTAFYERLGELKDYHARFPDLEITLGEGGGEADAGAAAVPPPRVEFSGDEAGGRCLDVHDLHLEFVNSKRFGRQCEYADYVRGLADFRRVPRGARLTKAWRDYLGRLLAYLEGFYDRTQPLSQLSKVYAKLDLASFRARFDAGEVEGWADCGLSGEPATAAPGGVAALPPAAQLDLEAFESPQELEAVGADKLKDALAALGLKSGGTPAQRAARLFLTKCTPLDQLDRKHFAKGAAPPGGLPPPADPAKAAAAARSAAELEAKVGALVAALQAAVNDTVAAVEKKQARTYEEIMADAEEVEEVSVQDGVVVEEGMGGGRRWARERRAGGGGTGVVAPAARLNLLQTPSSPPPPQISQADVVSDEEEEEYVYNPLHLPLGWDGKPIPYWLYKLHGLNVEFKCEVCGNFSYWGRREYERHFTDVRHLTGLRALGIPTHHVKDFYEVTKIDDAKALWDNLRARRGGGGVAAAEEEVEDADGNVYDRRTYDDLRRQGVV